MSAFNPQRDAVSSRLCASLDEGTDVTRQWSQFYVVIPQPGQQVSGIDSPAPTHEQLGEET